ncbi:MAG: insulinase family protein, partial [Polyangiaceae bacterium]|nr:insulinase family protein [Polyangiaceae bacterium]
TLANGLRLILHVDPTTPTVSVNIWYHVGSKDEPNRRNGFAHLFEHLMFQGSKHVGEDQFFMYLEQAGASDFNGTTSLDRTNYYATVPSNQLELALWLESDRMGFLLDHVNEDTFETQRRVVLNERRQNYVEAPYGMVRRFIQERMFPSEHPYHNLTIGSPEDLRAASLTDVQDFYKTFYVPNNATLVIAGDIDPAATKGLVEKYFGPIPRSKAPRVHSTPVPVQVSGDQVIEVEAAVELARVYVTYPTPAFFAEGDAELDGVSQILSNGKSSRLYKRLVYDLKIAKDVKAYQASNQLASWFQIMATGMPDIGPQALLSAIDEELEKARQAPPTAAETARAKAILESSLIFRIEQVGERADMFNTYSQMLGTPDYFARDILRYRAITPESLHMAVKTYLPKSNRIIVQVHPTTDAPRSGRIKGDNQ